jgi:hypothetical protein
MSLVSQAATKVEFVARLQPVRLKAYYHLASRRSEVATSSERSYTSRVGAPLGTEPSPDLRLPSPYKRERVIN